MIKKLVYRRCCLTFDIATTHKVKELAAAQGQSVSSYVRYLVAEAYLKAQTIVSKHRITGART
jgi:hypothetical protein